MKKWRQKILPFVFRQHQWCSKGTVSRVISWETRQDLKNIAPTNYSAFFYLSKVISEIIFRLLVSGLKIYGNLSVTSMLVDYWRIKISDWCLELEPSYHARASENDCNISFREHENITKSPGVGWNIHNLEHNTKTFLYENSFALTVARPFNFSKWVIWNCEL